MAEPMQPRIARDETSGISLRVEAEMTRLLYRSAGFGLFSNFVLAAVLVAGVWSYFPLRTLVGDHRRGLAGAPGDEPNFRPPAAGR
jgi:hypothetical protein